MPIESVSQNIQQAQMPKRNVSNELDRDAFMKILVAQLKNQDPLNPIEDQDFIAQMAQFSVLEQIQSLNDGFSFSQATGLVGKHVYAEFSNENGQMQRVFGKVTSALSIGGQPYLEVDGWHIPYTSQIVVYNQDPNASSGQILNPDPDPSAGLEETDGVSGQSAASAGLEETDGVSGQSAASASLEGTYNISSQSEQEII